MYFLCMDGYRTMPISLFVGIPLVAVCYLLVNVAFFIVLSYDEILDAKAVALVSWSNHGYCTKSVLQYLHLYTMYMYYVATTHVCIHV